MCTPCWTSLTVRLVILQYKFKDVHKNICLSFLKTKFSFLSSKSLFAEVDEFPPRIADRSDSIPLLARRRVKIQCRYVTFKEYLFCLYVHMYTCEFLTCQFDWPYYQTGHAQVGLIVTTWLHHNWTIIIPVFIYYQVSLRLWKDIFNLSFSYKRS